MVTRPKLKLWTPSDVMLESKASALDFKLEIKIVKIGSKLYLAHVKVWLKNGTEAQLYIHIEIQNKFEENFAERIFTYHYRLFDRYKQPLISLVVLGDNDKEWRPIHYGYDLAGCRLSFDFPVVKLLDYQKKWAELEQSKNPFSIVVRTHLKALETRWSPKNRLRWKMSLFKALYEANYSKQDILELFRFMDWVLGLPEPFALQFDQFIDEYEEAKKMPYVTSIERRGILRQSQEDVVEVLRVRFKDVHESLVKVIHAIYDHSFLSKLLREAILVNSLEAFEKLAKKPDKDND